MIFKPFDKVMVRDNSNEHWEINLYSHYYPNDPMGMCYKMVDRSAYRFCKPYDEEEFLSQFEPQKSSYASDQLTWLSDNGVQHTSIVKVVMKTDSFKGGWGGVWLDWMDRTVGMTGEVIRIDKEKGLRVSFFNMSCSDYDYPYFVLKVIKP